jgi:hypothetical protein
VNESFEFDIFDIKRAIQYAQLYAKDKYTREMGIVLTVAFTDKRNLPTFRCPPGEKVILSEYILRWVTSYLKGYENRPSKRTANRSSTFSDSIVKVILQSRLPNINAEFANQLEGGHSLMMTIENIVGDLLEEYLSIKLIADGWCCCWGSTIDAVDFCKADGSLLQIKNSDNSENSSSSRVRSGTTIKKWFRRVSTRESTYVWGTLNKMVSCNNLSEDDFRNFISKTIKENPSCIFIEDNHPLRKI